MRGITLGCAALVGVAVLGLCACQPGDGDKNDGSKDKTSGSQSTGSTGSGSSGGSDGTAEAAPGAINGAGLDKTYDCGGRKVSITGAGSTLKLLGECPLLNVTGANNKVTVEKAGIINVTGAHSTVVYGSGISGAPTVNATGRGSSAKQGDTGSGSGNDDGGTGGSGGTDRSSGGSSGSGGSGAGGAERAGSVHITGSSLNRSVSCTATQKYLYVTGSSNQVTASGCETVYLAGDNNHLVADRATRLVNVTGSHNVVGAAGHPAVVDLGTDNKVG